MGIHKTTVKIRLEAGSTICVNSPQNDLKFRIAYDTIRADLV